eukprot:12424350-Karenia_brevis.AAC.1
MPEEAKHNRQGYAEWVDRLAHNWTRGAPKAPQLPTSATYDGTHYGRPSTLGPKVPKGLGSPVGTGGPNLQAND